jgi:hypothetical protein
MGKEVKLYLINYIKIKSKSSYASSKLSVKYWKRRNLSQLCRIESTTFSASKRVGTSEDADDIKVVRNVCSTILRSSST